MSSSEREVRRICACHTSTSTKPAPVPLAARGAFSHQGLRSYQRVGVAPRDHRRLRQSTESGTPPGVVVTATDSAFSSTKLFCLTAATRDLPLGRERLNPGGAMTDSAYESGKKFPEALPVSCGRLTVHAPHRGQEGMPHEAHTQQTNCDGRRRADLGTGRSPYGLLPEPTSPRRIFNDH